MSIRDQQWAMKAARILIYGSALFSFPLGFYLQSFGVVTMAVLGAAAVTCILIIPNWRQRPDVDEGGSAFAYVPREDVDQYYEALRNSKKEKEE